MKEDLTEEVCQAVSPIVDYVRRSMLLSSWLNTGLNPESPLTGNSTNNCSDHRASKCTGSFIPIFNFK